MTTLESLKTDPKIFQAALQPLVHRALVPNAEEPTDRNDVSTEVLLIGFLISKFFEVECEDELRVTFQKYLETVDKLAGLAPAPPESPHTYYQLDATHYRFHSKWTGHVHSVRVTLPEGPSEVHEISTPLGDVCMADHSARHAGLDLSTHRAWFKEDISAGYHFRFLHDPPPFETLDLITGVRRHWLGNENLPYNRFCPLSIYIAKDTAGKPVFYALESGGFLGHSGRVHFAECMDSEILSPSGFKPTLFTKPQFYYRGRLKLDENHEPQLVNVYVSQDTDGPVHFHTQVRFDVLGEQPSLAKQFEYGAEFNQLCAILRQFVIAQGLGYCVPPQHTKLNELLERIDPHWERDLGNAIAEHVRDHDLLPWTSLPLKEPGIDRILPPKQA